MSESTGTATTGHERAGAIRAALADYLSDFSRLMKPSDVRACQDALNVMRNHADPEWMLDA